MTIRGLREPLLHACNYGRMLDVLLFWEWFLCIGRRADSMALAKGFWTAFQPRHRVSLGQDVVPCPLARRTRCVAKWQVGVAMGHQVQAKCLDCGCAFTVCEGGGFSFHLLRCDRCGGTKAVGFAELGELHVRYVKGLRGPYCLASAERDREIQEHAPVEPISQDEYHKGVEAFAGVCKCGGRYAFAAPVRCPQCRSARIEQGRPTIMYD
jgi:hypothetical protein